MIDCKEVTKTAKIRIEIKNKDCFFIESNIMYMLINYKIVSIKYQWGLL